MLNHPSAILLSVSSRAAMVAIMAFVMVFSCLGCSSGKQASDDSSDALASPNQRKPVVYIRGQAVEYGTGRVIANAPPPRKSTAEEELLEETRRKSDVTIWAAVAAAELLTGGRSMQYAALIHLHQNRS